MFISKISLINWKNFQEVEIDLTQRVFMVGANASGKSNFLDAIRFLRDIVKQSGGLQYAVEQRGGISKIRCLSAHETHLVINIQLSQYDQEKIVPAWEYFLSFQQSPVSNKVEIIDEKVTNLKDNSLVLDRNNNNDNDPITLQFTHLEQINSNKAFREIYSFLKEIQYFHVIPQLIKEGDLTRKEDFYGKDFLSYLSQYDEQSRNVFINKITELLKLAVPQFQNMQFVIDKKTGIPHLETEYKQNESQFSDGTIRLIGLLWALLDGESTLLLEEPELHLHVEIIKQLPEFIYKLQRKNGKTRQIIISTHSYDLLSNEGIGGEEVILLLPTKEGTTIHSAIQLEDVKKYLEAGFSMAEAIIPKTSPENIHNMNYLGFE